MQGALEAQVDAALGITKPPPESQARFQDDIDTWAGPTAQEMDQMRAEAATGAAANSSPSPSPSPSPRPSPSRSPSPKLHLLVCVYE